jgi:hypothetical protein
MKVNITLLMMITLAAFATRAVWPGEFDFEVGTDIQKASFVAGSGWMGLFVNAQDGCAISIELRSRSCADEVS